VGPAKELRFHGIKIHADVPGVGSNLQDHVVVIQPFETYQQLGLSLRDDKTLGNAFKYFSTGTGPFATDAVEVNGFAKTDPNRITPDIQYTVLSILPVDLMMDNVGFVGNPFPEKKWGFAIGPTLLHPESKGSVKLFSSDPLKHPIITANYLSAEKDMKALIEGLKMARRVGWESNTLKGKVKELLIFPGEDNFPLNSDEELRQYVVKHSYTLYHPVGSCCMGPESDPNAVVDPQLRVRGIKGLRVVDASVMPTLPSGNTNIPSIMVAEKAADVIKAAHKPAKL